MSDNLKQVDLASETIAVFEDHGEDLSDTRHVIHYFYGGNFAALEQELIKRGYETRFTVDDDGIVAERNDVIGEEWRTTTLRQLCEMADQFGVEYDGWEAAMTRQGEENSASEKTGKTSWLSKVFGKKN